MTGNPEAIPGQKSSCGSFTRLSNDKRACVREDVLDYGAASSVADRVAKLS